MTKYPNTPMSDPLEMVVEECSEVVQKFMKVLRFGPEGTIDYRANNKPPMLVLIQELADLTVTLEILKREGSNRLPGGVMSLNNELSKAIDKKFARLKELFGYEPEWRKQLFLADNQIPVDVVEDFTRAYSSANQIVYSSPQKFIYALLQKMYNFGLKVVRHNNQAELREPGGHYSRYREFAEAHDKELFEARVEEHRQNKRFVEALQLFAHRTGAIAGDDVVDHLYKWMDEHGFGIGHAPRSVANSVDVRKVVRVTSPLGNAIQELRVRCNTMISMMNQRGPKEPVPFPTVNHLLQGCDEVFNKWHQFECSDQMGTEDRRVPRYD
jgi:hypothetical protein